MKRFNSLLFVLCVCLVAQAEVIKQSPSLASGERYRLAFVTSTTTTAESDGIETYNAFVQATADAAPIGDWDLDWKAIGSTETISARQNTSTDPESDESVPIFLLNGMQLVPGYSRLWDADGGQTIFLTFDVNEFGERFVLPDNPLLTIWTGTRSDGFPREDSALGDARATTGFGDTSSNSWFDDSTAANHLDAKMYALSEVLIAVPEPTGQAHLLVLLALLSISRRKAVQQLSQ